MKGVKKISLLIRSACYKVKNRKNNEISVFAEIGKNVILEGGNSVGKKSRLKNAVVGYGTYIGDYTNLEGCVIGKYCSIGSKVHHIKGTHPTSEFVSTHPAFYSPQHPCMIHYVKQQKFEEYKYIRDGYNVEIGNDVWIGYGVKILDGVKISDGAILAAGAVVTNNVEPYSIVGGVPAKNIKYRFSEEEIKMLLEMKWWNLSAVWIKKNSKSFTSVRELYELYKTNNF